MTRAHVLFAFSLVACGGGAADGPSGPSNGGTTGATTGATTSSGAPCQDLDGDGYGLDCALGTDCDESSQAHWADCGTCVDGDHDTYGDGCDLGEDCHDDNNRTRQCEGCADADGDGHWDGCELVSDQDCDDDDGTVYQNLAGFVDGDGDGYSADEAAGSVCTGDTLPAGYLTNNPGLDCDDSNPAYTTLCPAKMLGNLFTGYDGGALESSPDAFTSIITRGLASVALFRATDENNGIELFRASPTGSTVGVSIVRDIVPGTDSARIDEAVKFGSSDALFVIDDGIHGKELWISDGTASGTRLVVDQNAGPGNSDLGLFGGSTPAYVRYSLSLYTTDGTTVSSFLGALNDDHGHAVVGSNFFVASNDHVSGGAGLKWSHAGAPLALVSFTGMLNRGEALALLKGSASQLYVLVRSYNSADTQALGDSIWSIGTGANGGTATRITTASYLPYNDYLLGGRLNGSLYVTHCPGVEGCELFRVSGGDLVLVKNINPGSAHSTPTRFVSCGGVLYFTATDGAHGKELWKTGGSAATTVMVKDINPGAGGSEPSWQVCSSNKLFFVANDGNDIKLWMADDANGIVRLASNAVIGITFSATNIFPFNGGVLYAPDIAGEGRELRFTTGAIVNDHMVFEYKKAHASAPSAFHEFDGKAVFSATDASKGRELWSSDGTGAGTARVLDINSNLADSNPGSFQTLGNKLLFTATNSSGSELWASDLTGPGTYLVKDINSSGSTAPSELTVIGTKLFFSATDTTNGREPWVSDGTDAGTSLVSNLATTTTDSSPAGFTAFGPSVFFSATTAPAAVGRELWSTTTASPTTANMFDDFNVTGDSAPTSFTVVGDKLFFVAKDVASGAELRRIDDAGTGVLLVKDINPGAADAAPASLFVHDGKLFFVATDVDGKTLWVVNAGGTDATKLKPAGETPLDARFFVSVGTTLFFVAKNATNGEELWKSDGTPAGTSRLSQIGSGSASAGIQSLHAIDAQVFFFASGSAGVELYKSNGTTPTLVKDINPGPLSSGVSYRNIVRIKPNKAVFAAASPQTGVELWLTDGTSGGTVVLQDLVSGAGSSNPRNFKLIGTRLYFNASTGTAGEEPWVLDTSGL